MRDRINEYFAQLSPVEVHLEKENVKGKGLNQKTQVPEEYETTTTKEIVSVRYDQGEPVPTVNGLALFLGFAGRKSLNEYLNTKPEFSYTIRAALAVIERYHEIKVATSDKPQGSIFLLQGMGWTTKAELEVNSNHPQQTFVIGGKTITFE
jgi:hypothetical protein